MEIVSNIFTSITAAPAEVQAFIGACVSFITYLIGRRHGKKTK